RPGSPGATTSRAMTSVSTSDAPSSTSFLATMDLPLAIPPVKPMVSMRALPSGPVEVWTLEQQVLIELDQGLAPKQRDPAGAGEIGAEGDRRVARAAAERDHRDADDGADHRRQQDDERQRLPAEPGAECREQLEVAEAHAFLARRELEKLIDGPERKI